MRRRELLGTRIREVSGGGGVGVEEEGCGEDRECRGLRVVLVQTELEVQQLQPQQQPKLSVASVSKDGKVSFEATKDRKSV